MKRETDRKSRRRKLKLMKRQLNSETFELESELVLNDKDDAQIECKVGKIENLFSQFDIAKNRTINEAFHNYLMQETEIIPAKHNLEIKLYVNEDTTQEQADQIKKAIKRHYSFMITSANIGIRKTTFFAFILYLGGLLSLALNFLADSLTSVLPLKETLLIITWFFVWEATSLAFFDRGSQTMRRFNMLRIYNAKVTFIKDNSLSKNV